MLIKNIHKLEGAR